MHMVSIDIYSLCPATFHIQTCFSHVVVKLSRISRTVLTEFCVVDAV